MSHPDDEIQKEYRDQMQILARELDQYFNPQCFVPLGTEDFEHTTDELRNVGFVLMVFPFGEHKGGRFNYISNGADRKDIVCLMKEMIARFEGQPEQTGNS